MGKTPEVSPTDPTSSYAAERAFFVEEFARSTLVVALDRGDLSDPSMLTPVIESLDLGGSRLILVVGTDDPAVDVDLLAQELHSVASPAPVVHPFMAASLADPSAGGADDEDSGDALGPDAHIDEAWMADLWLSALDHGWVVVAVPMERRSVTAAWLATVLGALKLVVTDSRGGLGRPPRSFADVSTHRDAYRSQLGDRQGGAVVDAIEVALGGGVTSVNLCRAADLDRELFTFDGTGTLFTSGGYVEVVPLGVDDLSTVEDLVAQGTADGLLRPRSRQEIARLAVGGLGAKVIGSGHLAGVVGLETEAYRAEGLGEVAALFTVSRFSGAGAGGALIEGLVERAAEQGLRAVFAVTVSDVAAEFFLRRGFREVDTGEVPESKWRGYDPARRSEARAFWRDVEDPEDPVAGF